MNKRNSPATVAVLTGGIDPHYACALGKALASSGMALDVIANTEMSSCEMRSFSNLRVLPFYPTLSSGQGLFGKLLFFIGAYLRIVTYAATSSAHTFHILWNYKFQLFDRTLLLVYYKLLGKKIVLTAHNVNAAERDGVDTWLNRLTLQIQYSLLDHIFVHTESMKEQLARSFGISVNKITVIPFGVGGMVPLTDLTPAEAKLRLHLGKSDRTILFFGRITRYKGLDLLVDAFEKLALHDRSYRLIIAGEPIKDTAELWQELHGKIESGPMAEQVVQEIRYVADEEMEVYFKASDVLVLPYKQIFQSGVLFMSHSFGLPVVATDVGTFRDDIAEGSNGYVCRPNDAEDLAKTIERYFSSELFRSLDERRAGIQDSVRLGHSWDIVGKTTADIYSRLAQFWPSGHDVSSGHSARGPLNNQSSDAESHDSGIPG